MKTVPISVGGMTCVNCQNRIEKKLRATAGIENAAVDYRTGVARVDYDESAVTLSEIEKIIESLGYTITNGKQKELSTETFGIIFIIIALFLLLRNFGFTSLTGNFPLAEAGMNYAMLFVIGLITSVHCVAMCGGINLSQCIPAAANIGDNKKNRRTVLLPSILYNAGRVISYTLVGVIVGALGQVITVTGFMQGVVQLAAGVFMVIMGINILGIFPALRRFNLHLPKIFAQRIDEQKAANKSPLVVGLLNGLMPCGPLQAMQLYALSTGSPIAGGISMFLFCMGTVPLMFGIGALSTLLSKRFTAVVMRVGAILVAVLGLTMFSNGWSLSGFSSIGGGMFNRNAAAIAGADGSAFAPRIENGVQMVNSTLAGGRYPAIIVQAGIPVKWTINAPQGSINGCNNRMIIREYGIQHSFKTGDNVIEFTPEKTGKIPYSCWMGMIRSSITVVAEGQSIADVPEPSLAPIPAGVQIDAARVAVAEFAEFNGGGVMQRVSINLRDDGFEPAVLVVERNVPTFWTINNDSLDAGNAALIFPAYYTQMGMDTGDNIIQLIPEGDFDFSTLDNVFYGYVKVVDSLDSIDIDAIKDEVSGWETQIYPAAYFEEANAGGCCN
jgi:sulfite exporter TauE/SafE/copper chaperone CopZ